MKNPTRLQLSRAKGFNLEKISKGFNGREGVSVVRSTALGNPFVVNPNARYGKRNSIGGYYVPTAEDAVECYRLMLDQPGPTADAHRAAIKEVRGKNLACWCNHGAPCHADVILELANREDEGCTTT